MSTCRDVDEEFESLEIFSFHFHLPVPLPCLVFVIIFDQIPIKIKANTSITLDADLRTDGIPALDLWDLSTEVLHFPTTGAP